MKRTPPQKYNTRLTQSSKADDRFISNPYEENSFQPDFNNKSYVKQEPMKELIKEKNKNSSSNIKKMSDKVFGGNTVSLTDKSQEFRMVDFANNLGYDNDILQSQKQILAITQPKAYLIERQKELEKVKQTVNKRSNKMYERYLNLSYPKGTAKKLSEQYAQGQLASELQFLNINYPTDISKLAEGKTYNKSIDLMRGDKLE